MYEGTPTPALEEKKMSIIVNEKNKTFHLYNNQISYLMSVLPNGHIGQLYFGKRIDPEQALVVNQMFVKPIDTFTTSDEMLAAFSPSLKRDLKKIYRFECQS